MSCMELVHGLEVSKLLAARPLEIQSQTTWLLISLGCRMRLSHTTMQALRS